MGEIAHVDLGRLRRLADGIASAGDDIGDIGWPELDPAALPGSMVAPATNSARFTSAVGKLVTALRDWASAAHASADAFEGADTTNGQRFAPR